MSSDGICDIAGVLELLVPRLSDAKVKAPPRALSVPRQDADIATLKKQGAFLRPLI